MSSSTEKPWQLYILRCSDNTFYTGITDNLDARLNKHNSGKGAKYTRSRVPTSLVYSETYSDKKSAMLREIEVKIKGSSLYNYQHSCIRTQNCIL